jgi:hypothetical protein
MDYMRRNLLSLSVLLLGSCAAGTASAEPYFAVAMGLKCSACHFNPTGGGLRNTFGSVWGQTSLPAHVKLPKGGPWTGQLGRYLGVGANLRYTATRIDAPRTPATSSHELTSLRVYADVRLIPERVSLYLDERVAPGAADNRETYLLARTADHRFYIKAGQMYLPFGIRLQDDSAFTREQTGISFATPDRGVEIGFDGAQWTAQLAASNGTAGGPEVDKGKQWSLRSEYVTGRWRSGASFNYNDFDTGSRRMENVFGGLRTGPVGWLAELDFITEKSPGLTRHRAAALLEANWSVHKGHNLKIAGEYFDPNRNAGRDQQTRWSAVWEYTPLPFVQLRAGARNYDDLRDIPFLNQRILFLQLNGYF